MKQYGDYPSCAEGRIHFCRWTPQGEPRAVLQIIHGIGEHVDRYDDFAAWLCSRGYLVVAEDHMGHGRSLNGTPGYFAGGWLSAVGDSYQLLKTTREEFPDLPYVLLGHSMGSFMARTILCKYPDSGISGAILSGTGWQSRSLLPLGLQVCRAVCRKKGEKTPSPFLEKAVFGGYNRKVDHPRTAYDWLCRDTRVVDAYAADPLCGFTPSAGLMRDLLTGLAYIEDPENLCRMDRNLPVLFLAGSADPVGNYGKGVIRTAEAFRALPMGKVTLKLYPMMRHEILNEIGHQEVYGDIDGWIQKMIFGN